MTYLFYSCICLSLIILQTTMIPYSRIFSGCYDLLIPFILYLGIFRPAREGLIVLSLLGFMMDNLSAGPFGLYWTAYLWLFIITKWMITFLHAANQTLFPFIATMGVLIENLIFFGALMMSETDAGVSGPALRIVGEQMIWALFTGGFLISFFDYAHNRVEKWIEERFPRED